MYGYYRKESTYINGKPHYTSMSSSGEYAIWYVDGVWMIGRAINRGSLTGYAYNKNNYDCPYNASDDWKHSNHNKKWVKALGGIALRKQC